MIEQISYQMHNIFQLAEIEKQCFGRDAWSIPALRGEFENDFSYFFGEVEDGKILGYVCVRIMYEEAQICNIAVLPQHRRKGIGRRLLEEIATFAADEGCERCQLEVNTQNEPAVGLYAACGYNVEGVRKNFYRKSRYPSRDAYTMVKPLQ